MEQQRRGAGDFAPSHSLKMIQACVSSLKCQHDRCSRASSNQTDMASVWSEDCRNSSKPKRNSCHIEHVIDIPCTHPNCQVTLCSHVLRQTGGTVGLQDCPCNVQPTTALVFNLSAMVTTMNQAVAFKCSCHQESSESRFSHTGINSHFISSIMWNGSAQPRKLQQGVCNEHVRNVQVRPGAKERQGLVLNIIMSLNSAVKSHTHTHSPQTVLQQLPVDRGMGFLNSRTLNSRTGD